MLPTQNIASLITRREPFPAISEGKSRLTIPEQHPGERRTYRRFLRAPSRECLLPSQNQEYRLEDDVMQTKKKYWMRRSETRSNSGPLSKDSLLNISVSIWLRERSYSAHNLARLNAW